MYMATLIVEAVVISFRVEGLAICPPVIIAQQIDSKRPGPVEDLSMVSNLQKCMEVACML